MAHEHSHGEGTQSYYVEQLVSLAACGLIAVSALLLYRTNFLIGYKILAPDFVKWVLWGGMLLSGLVFFRMVGIFLTAGVPAEGAGESHDHAHSHAEHSHGEHAHAEHSHGGEVCGHDHGGSLSLPMVPAAAGGHDDHDHGMAPVRLVVLLIPSLLILICLGFGIRLPKEFGSDYLNKRLKPDELELGQRSKAVEGKTIRLQFNELARAAIFPKTRDYFDGRKGVLKGQYKKIDDKTFTLFKVDMKCCAADQLFITARIICSETVQEIKPNEWIEVEGDIQFVQTKGQANEWVPVLYVDKESQIKPTQPE